MYLSNGLLDICANDRFQGESAKSRGKRDKQFDGGAPGSREMG